MLYLVYQLNTLIYILTNMFTLLIWLIYDFITHP